MGDMRAVEHLVSGDGEERQPHPLQELVEDVVGEKLTEHEREIFFLRFGEQLPFREIADRMGYDSHQTFQYHVNKIMKKVRDAIEQRDDADSDSGDAESNN